MHAPRARTTPARLSLALGALFLVTATAGCDATPAAAPSAPAESSTPPVASVASVVDEVTDVESCTAFADVSTLVFNASIGLRENRMSDKEYQGWMRLGTRLLDRVPTSGVGDVSEAIAKLKAQAPPTAAGAAALGADGFGADVPLAAACTAAGADLGVEAFTGG